VGLTSVGYRTQVSHPRQVLQHLFQQLLAHTQLTGQVAVTLRTALGYQRQ